MLEAAIAAAVVLLLGLYSAGLKRLGLRNLLFIALLSALAACGRMVFAAIPSVQPASFIIIVCGLAFGPAGGLAAGTLTSLLSSLLTSLGPWTLWQTLLWALMGLLAGYGNVNRRLTLGVFGLASGFVFGWVMNLWYYSLGIIPFSLAAYFAACISSFPFDLAHGLTNLALLFFFSKRLVHLIDRLKQTGSEE